MKNLMLILSSTLLMTSTSFAKQKAAEFVPQISQTDTPEVILVKSSRAIREIYQNLGLGNIQVQSNNLVHEIQSEIVTKSESHRSKTSLAGKISLLFAGGSGSYDSSSASQLDYTQIVTTNPLQILRQEDRASSDLGNLRSQLLKIMNSHEEDLVILKELGLLQASAAYQMATASEDVPWDEVNTNMKMVSDLNFQGLQTVTHCVTTKHAKTNTYDTSDESAGLRLHLLFFSIKLGGSDHQENYYRHVAYTEKQCTSTTNTVNLSPQATVYAVNMSLLDAKISRWKKALEIVQVTQDHHVFFPTWGSPYYQQ